MFFIIKGTNTENLSSIGATFAGWSERVNMFFSLPI